MKKARKPLWKRILRFLLWLALVPVLLLVAIIGIIYFDQDALIQDALLMADQNFNGKITVKGSHVSFIHDFPDVSIDVEELCIYEDKLPGSKPIVKLEHLFFDFDAWKVLHGRYSVNHIEANGGRAFIVQDKDGEYNIMRAFESKDTAATVPDTSSFRLNLKKVTLKNIFITHFNKSNEQDIQGKFEEVHASFRNGSKSLSASVDGKFMITVIKGKDTSFIREKDFSVNASIRYSKKYNLLTVHPSEIKMEQVPFDMQGCVSFQDKLYMNMKFSGNNDFDLLFAFLPDDLGQYMKRYEHDGNLFFNSTVRGLIGNGNQPQILANFGCEHGFIKNSNFNRKVDSLEFTGYFTNGSRRNMSTFEIGVLNMSARPEQGNVKGNIVVRNFENPVVNMDVSTDFDLQFLEQFLQLPELKHLSGQVQLKVHYNELVDIAMPKTTFARLKQGVDSELRIHNLSFKLPGYPHIIKNLNMSADMISKELTIDYLNANVGTSDISLKGSISNLPNLLHRSHSMENIFLSVASKRLNLKELTTFDSLKMKPLDEQLSNFTADLKIHTSAKHLLDTTRIIPLGDFSLSNLNMNLNYYTHPIKNFDIGVHVDTNRIDLQQFQGMIGKTDINLTASMKNYRIWFDKETRGTSSIDYKLVSDAFHLRNLVNYRGKDYLPEDYRREKIKGLYFEGNAQLTYDRQFQSIDIKLENVEGKLKMHPLRLDKIQGQVQYSDQRLRLNNLSGMLGDNDFTVTTDYYLGDDGTKMNNGISIRSKHLNLNEVLNFTPTQDTAKANVAKHDSVFNVFDLPFSNMRIKADIDELIFKEITIKNLEGRMRMQQDHDFFIDSLDMDIADGHIDIAGVFDGTHPDKIFFSPNVNFYNVDLNKLFLKFDNFGQNYILSENITGTFTGKLTGDIRMHSDLTPIIEQSKVELDVRITNGSLDNYGPMSLLSHYFKDKNLKLIRFDTLVNSFTLDKGIINIPNMWINSSLGYIEFSGTQALSSDMDYHVKVPMKMVGEVGFKYLFEKKKEEVDSTRIDDIIVHDPHRKMKFVNVHIKGNSEDYKITLKKK